MNTSKIVQSVRESRRAAIRKEVDRILDQRSEADRIRDAFKLWLRINPKIQVTYSDDSRAYVTAKVAYKQTLEKIRFLRSMHETELGITYEAKHKKSVGNLGMRALMEFPPGSIEFMKMFAMEAFSGDPQSQKKATMRLAKIFPELVVPEKL